MKKIATHNGVMHADEITAVALIKLFIDEEVVVERMPHESRDFYGYDFVIDIGRVFDGKRYFDHHQYKGGKSSAGLIWEYIGLGERYPKISKLVAIVDKHDVGEERAKEFEYPSLLKCYNTHEPFSDKQDDAFMLAVAFAYKVLKSYKEADEEAIRAKEIVASSFVFDGNPNIMELKQFTPFWNVYVNGEKTPHIKVVVWEDDDGSYKARVTPKVQGSFKLHGKMLKEDLLASFVHSAGHFAVFENEQKAKEYFKKYKVA